MKNTIYIIVFYFLTITVCNGQTNSNFKSNALSLELGKAGLIFNVTFDHRLKTKNYGYKLNIGSNLTQYQQVFQTGGGFYYLKGHNKNFLELGIDLSYFEYIEVSDDQRVSTLLFFNKYLYTKTLYSNINIGYRYYGNKNLFRVGVSPGLMNTGFLFGGFISFGVML